MRVTNYEISADAQADIDDLYAYSLLNFGIRQADRYIDSLYDCFSMLGDYPSSGRGIDEIVSGARRHTHQEHVIYYRPASPLLILRVLGGAQDPIKQFDE